MDTLLEKFKLNEDQMNCLKGGLPDVVADGLPVASDPLPVEITYQTVEFQPGPQDAYSNQEQAESSQPHIIKDHIHLFASDTI